MQTDHAFTADSPDASLIPIWAELPVGPVFVAVDVMDASGNTIAHAGKRTLLSPPLQRLLSAKELLLRRLHSKKTYEYLFQLDFIPELSKGIVDPDSN